MSAKAYVEYKKSQKPQSDIAPRQSPKIGEKTLEITEKTEQTQTTVIPEETPTIVDKIYEEPKETPQTDSPNQVKKQSDDDRFKAAKKLLEKYSNL